MRCFSFALLFAVLVNLPAAGAHAAIWFVDGDAAASGDGTSWGSAFQTIQEAMGNESTVAGDEIWVKQGTYALASRIDVDKAVDIYGGFDGTETARNQRNWETNVTTVDGGDALPCFRVTAPSPGATVDGFTITRGRAFGEQDGGGMYLWGDSTIANCVFSNNSAVDGTVDGRCGGAMAMGGNSTSPLVTDCTFDQNTAGVNGGAIYNSALGSSSPTISNCTFASSNTAQHGGAIYNLSTDITVVDCTFVENNATYGGGAIYNQNTTGTISGCTFSTNTTETSGNGGGVANVSSPMDISACTFNGNSAQTGGGMHNSACSPTISRCIFRGNTCDLDASGAGGAIRNNSSNAAITSCLFYDNSVTYLAGGIFNYDSSHAVITNCTFSGNFAGIHGGAVGNTTSDPSFVNCILWADTATTSGNEVSVISGTPTFTYCDIEGGTGESWFGTGCIDIDPLLLDISDPDSANWDLHLRTGSPCIDAGDNSPSGGLPATDIDGEARTIDGDRDGTAVVDMGADEASATCHCVSNTTELQDALSAAQGNHAHDIVQVVRGTYNGNFIYISSQGYSVTLEGGYSVGCTGRTLDPARTVLDGGGNDRVLRFRDNNGGDVLVDGVTIQNGAAAVDGGGIAVSSSNSGADPSGDVTITHCIVTANTADGNGGGVAANSYAETTSGDVTLVNNIIAGNTAEGAGGGAKAASFLMTSGSTTGVVTCTNNTVVGNDADRGGGVFLNIASDGAVDVYNNIIWGNTAATDGGDIYLFKDPGAIASSCNNDVVDDQVAGHGWDYWDDNIDVDPLLVNPGPGNFRLRPGSACIDVGLNTAPRIPDRDFEADERIIDGDHDGTATVDMGADEYRAQATVAPLLPLLLE